MMPLRQRAVGGADLRGGAAAIEPERGVVIVFGVFQCPTLSRCSGAASLNVAPAHMSALAA